MSYNLTAIVDNSTGFVEFFRGVSNVLTGGWLAIFILAGISIVILIAALFSTNDFKKSIIATLFINFIFSIIFRALELVKDQVIFISLVLLAGALALGFKSD